MASTTSPMRSCAELPSLYRGQVAEVDAQYGQVRFRVYADRFRFAQSPVAELHPDFGRVDDHMVIRDQITVCDR